MRLNFTSHVIPQARSVASYSARFSVLIHCQEPTWMLPAWPHDNECAYYIEYAYYILFPRLVPSRQWWCSGLLTCQHHSVPANRRFHLLPLQSCCWRLPPSPHSLHPQHGCASVQDTVDVLDDTPCVGSSPAAVQPLPPTSTLTDWLTALRLYIQPNTK